jgi:hypothetical protein
VENDNGEELLDQSESLDSDEVRNDDGDEVVDPPDPADPSAQQFQAVA